MKYDADFFYKYAGYAVSPGESPEQARRANAEDLADAREDALERGYSFSWGHDGTTSEEFSDEKPFYPLWSCVLLDDEMEIIKWLGGVDFGPDGTDGDDYARVIEAELALDSLDDDE